MYNMLSSARTQFNAELNRLPGADTFPAGGRQASGAVFVKACDAIAYDVVWGVATKGRHTRLMLLNAAAASKLMSAQCVAAETNRQYGTCCSMPPW